MLDFLRALLIKFDNKNQINIEFTNWIREGKPVPPPHAIKQHVLRTFAKKYHLKILVETGTYYGQMVDALKDDFRSIYSIELSQDLYDRAVEKFKAIKHIHLICGDSGVVLRNVLERVDQPALFWLDGHYSAGDTARGKKDTPIQEELINILNAPDLGHVIIIDDARCFGTFPAYPSVKELTDFVLSKRPNLDISVQDDSIRIVPRRER